MNEEGGREWLKKFLRERVMTMDPADPRASFDRIWDLKTAAALGGLVEPLDPSTIPYLLSGHLITAISVSSITWPQVGKCNFTFQITCNCYLSNIYI
jgi:hypothetical protein